MIKTSDSKCFLSAPKVGICHKKEIRDYSKSLFPLCNTSCLPLHFFSSCQLLSLALPPAFAEYTEQTPGLYILNCAISTLWTYKLHLIGHWFYGDLTQYRHSGPQCPEVQSYNSFNLCNSNRPLQHL
jgi:hypothetical protein